MSFYKPVGITDQTLLAKAEGTGGQPAPTQTGTPVQSVLDFMQKIGVSIGDALTNPLVKAFMQKMGVSIEELRREEKKQKRSLLLWGAAAATIVVFLALRKK
jgi:hypothetical protein